MVKRRHRCPICYQPASPGIRREPSRDLAELRARNKAHWDFLAAHGVWDGYVEPNRLNEQAGALINAIFETPAQTARDVLEKVRLLHIARGDYDDADNGDSDLEAHQDAENSPWFDSVIADLERLAGEARS